MTPTSKYAITQAFQEDLLAALEKERFAYQRVRDINNFLAREVDGDMNEQVDPVAAQHLQHDADGLRQSAAEYRLAEEHLAQAIHHVKMARECAAKGRATGKPMDAVLPPAAKPAAEILAGLGKPITMEQVANLAGFGRAL